MGERMIKDSCRDRTRDIGADLALNVNGPQAARTQHYRHATAVKLWALLITVGVHIIIFTAFGFVQFSRFKTDDNPAGPLGAGKPAASLKPVNRPAQTATIAPKPRIRKPALGISADRIELSAREIFANFKPAASIPHAEIYQQSAAGSTISTEALQPAGGVEFFGSFSKQRKICYVVDCSGSMQGLFGLVQERLCESVKQLQGDQYFDIIFFSGQRVHQFGSGQLVRASDEVKNQAYRFIDTARPAGKTNALAALEMAVQVRDTSGAGPEVIYFLTDGFELTAQGTQSFTQKTTELLAQFAPKTIINTIGFYTQPHDCTPLETIAQQSGGQFVLVTDSPGQAGTDFLEE